MFNLLKALACLMLLAGLSGCGTDDRYLHTEPPLDLSKVQLTLDVWNQIDESPEKYDPALMERLRQEEASLHSDEAWKKFQNDVMRPGMKEVLGKQ